jgi:hypothetical protein
MVFVVTCEHGSGEVPEWLRDSFASAGFGASSGVESAVTDGTSGEMGVSADCDPGALAAATHFAKTLRCPLIAAKYSPSVIDVNRSLGQRGLFSPLTKALPKRVRERIVNEIHRPYREEVESALERSIRQDQLVIHLSVHSFATFEPAQVNAETEDRAQFARRTDLGLLYDPGREYELALCLDWYEDLYYALPMLRVRRNYPRRGVSENLISQFRRKYSSDSYIGIELQLNRAWCVRDVPVRKKVFSGIAKSLLRLLDAAKQDQEAA